MKVMRGILVLGMSALALVGCGDGADLDPVQADAEVVENEEVETEEGLTFSDLSQSGDVVAYVDLARYVGE